MSFQFKKKSKQAKHSCVHCMCFNTTGLVRVHKAPMPKSVRLLIFCPFLWGISFCFILLTLLAVSRQTTVLALLKWSEFITVYTNYLDMQTIRVCVYFVHCANQRKTRRALLRTCFRIQQWLSRKLITILIAKATHSIANFVKHLSPLGLNIAWSSSQRCCYSKTFILFNTKQPTWVRAFYCFINKYKRISIEFTARMII